MLTSSGFFAVDGQGIRGSARNQKGSNSASLMPLYLLNNRRCLII